MLSARVLQDVANVNVFRPTDVVEFTQGDSAVIYFQLIDTAVDKDMRPPGRRFVPASSSVLQVTLHSINDAKTIIRYATQPFPCDGSIWQLTMMPTDTIQGSVSMKFVLTQGATATRGSADAVLRIYGQTQAI